MRSILRSSTAAAAFLLLAGAALAQPPDWYQQREERYRGQNWRQHMFTEIKADLDHVQATTYGGRDEFRLVRTKQELDELQSDLAAHRYTEAKLDEVIGTMQRVAADNRMSARDRAIVNDDLQRLRDYRAHHDSWIHEAGEREVRAGGVCPSSANCLNSPIEPLPACEGYHVRPCRSVVY